MAKERVSAAMWVAVLVPAVRVLPGACARLAGDGGWLAPLAALPVMLLLMRWLAKSAGAAVAPGRSLTIIYMVWALVLGSARLRLCVQRVALVTRQGSGVKLWAFIFAAAVVWVACGELDAFLRAAVVVGRILTATLLIVVVLTVPQIRPEELWPVWVGDLPEVALGVIYTAGTLCWGICGVFLWPGEWAQTDRTGRLAGSCVVLALLLTVVQGGMGRELAAQLWDPFLALSKHVGVPGAFRRVESLVAASWVLGDLALIALLVLTCRKLGVRLGFKWNERWLVAAAVLLLLAGNEMLFADGVAAQRFETFTAPLGNLAFGFAVLGLNVLRGRAGSAGTSCAERVGERKI